MHHFGEPLVSTPSDFGTRSNPPTHPELLDDLAARFMHGGLVAQGAAPADRALEHLSAGQPRPARRAAQVDPENRLLWRFNRRRLDLEAMRDTLLVRLGPARPDDGRPPGRRRRTTPRPRAGPSTAWSIARACPPSSGPSTSPAPTSRPSAGRRTTVPQQALFSMNSPFVIEQAKALAARPEVAGAHDPKPRIAALYRRVLARPPDADELEAGRRFLASDRPRPASPATVPARPRGSSSPRCCS